MAPTQAAFSNRPMPGFNPIQPLPPELKLRFNASNLIESGQISDAISLLEARLASDPQDGWNAEPLADAYFQAGRSYSALNMLRQIDPKYAEGDRSGFLLRCSLAAALNGTVYAGQRDYVVGWLTADRQHGAGMTDTTFLPIGSDANSMIFLSSLALMFKENSNGHAKALFYAQTAWNCDPGNPYVVDTLTRELGSLGFNKEAREASERAVSYLPADPRYNKARDELRFLRRYYMPDRDNNPDVVAARQKWLNRGNGPPP